MENLNSEIEAIPKKNNSDNSNKSSTTNNIEEFTFEAHLQKYFQ